jgi:hypothetical protein
MLWELSSKNAVNALEVRVGRKHLKIYFLSFVCLK